MLVEVSPLSPNRGTQIRPTHEDQTAWVLDAVHERTAQQIGTAVDMLLNHKDPTLQDAEVVTAALENFRKRPPLGFSDSLLVEIARKAGATCRSEPSIRTLRRWTMCNG